MSTFNFGGSSQGGEKKNPFGATSSTGGSSLFGNVKSTPGTSAPSLFGSTPASSGAPSGGLFGNAGGQSSAPSLFGGAAKTTEAPKLFGSLGTPTTTTPTLSFTSTTPQSGTPQTGAPSLFKSATSFGSATGTTSTAGSAGSQGGSTFSFSNATPASGATGASAAAPAGGSSLFSPPTTTNPAGSSTPAAARPMFSLPSTTPAGPPPSTSGPSFSLGQNQTSSLFGSAPKPASSLFGGGAAGTTTTPAAGSSPFSGFGSLGKPPAATTGQQPSSTPAPSTAAPSTAAPSTAAPAASAAPAAAQPSAAPSLFGQAASKPAGTPAGGSSLFGKVDNAAASSPFSLGAKNNAPAGTTPSQPAAGGLFPSLASKPDATSAAAQPSTQATAATTAASGTPAQAATTAPSFGGGLFGKPLGSATSSAAGTTGATTATSAATAPASSQPTSAATTATAAPPAGAGANPLQLNTANDPTPDPTSRLKNKSMDEIITKWATDLTKYQKEFTRSAEQVAAWDRLLVENSDKISKLYSKTFHAERDAAEIDKQLSTVENQQDELQHFLDRYEREIDELLVKGGVMGPDGVGLQGVDQERERTYKLAERLTERVNGLNRDVTDVIEEINTVSASLSKTNNPDDPLSHVVKVLNSHLQQLQQVDTATAALKEKVEAAQKDSGRMNASWTAAQSMGSDATADFYRSFRVRR